MLEEGGTRLQGLMGSCCDIDQQDSTQQDHQHAFEQYLQQLRANELTESPITRTVNRWRLDLHDDGSALDEAVRWGQTVLVAASEAALRLPYELVATFGTPDYAVLPLRAGSKSLGLMIVDNKINNQPLGQRMLEYLKTLLARAALTWENLRQRHSRDQLIKLNTTSWPRSGNSRCRPF